MDNFINIKQFIIDNCSNQILRMTKGIAKDKESGSNELRELMITTARGRPLIILYYYYYDSEIGNILYINYDDTFRHYFLTNNIRNDFLDLMFYLENCYDISLSDFYLDFIG